MTFRDAFKSSIEPDVEMPSKKAKRYKRTSTSMEIFGGREPELHSKSEESSEDEETILNTPPSTDFNKPKRLCALGPTLETLQGYCSEGELRDKDAGAVEDKGNHELSLPKPSSQHQMGSTTTINLPEIECRSLASLLQEDSDMKDTPIPAKEISTPSASGATESDGGTNFGNKRRNTTNSQSQPKQMTRNHSKPTQAKEVLRPC